MGTKNDWPDKPCPYCEADSGEPCKTPSGEETDVHQARKNLIIPEDHWCPTCKAEPGEACVTKSGSIAKNIHSTRETNFSVALGKLEMFRHGMTDSNEMPEEGKQLMRDMDKIMIGRNSLQWLFKKYSDVSPDMKRKNNWQYDPPEDRRIDEEGQYVMIIDTEQLTLTQFDWVEPGMTFYARHCENTDETGFNNDGYYKVRILTPEGEVHLWPHEYIPFDFETLSELYSQDELELHAREYDQDDLTQDVHYMMSRGIPAKKALGMALGNIQKDIGWFEPVDELKEELRDILEFDKSKLFKKFYGGAVA